VYSQWSEPVGNKASQLRDATNSSTGAYGSSLYHWFFGIGMVPMVPTGSVHRLQYNYSYTRSTHEMPPELRLSTIFG
jgi:hypothetical protein